MRHRSSRLRLNDKPDHSRSLQRNLVTSLFLYETIRTTRKRARVIQPIVDSIITTAKTKTPHIAIRAVNPLLSDKNASRKLMEVFTKRYSGRTSGFTRMVAVGARKGDGAELVDLTLVDADIRTNPSDAKAEKVAAKKPTKKKAASASATA